MNILHFCLGSVFTIYFSRSYESRSDHSYYVFCGSGSRCSIVTYFPCFYSTAVTGVCYVRPTRTIWVAAGTQEANMYDPKSGENVSNN